MSARPRVAVVGGGPAGCAAALSLIEAGVEDVVVFERGAQGKDKACGDAFLPEAVGFLSNAGIEVASCARTGGGRRFSTIDLWDDRGAVWEISLGPAEGWIMPRATVDQALRDIVARVSDLRYDTRVVGVEQASGRSWLLATCSADRERVIEVDAVVLATGASNLLSQRWGIDGQAVVGASMSAYVEGVCVDAPRFQFLPGELPGYGWVFPLAGGRANIGYCAMTTPRALRAATERYLGRWESTARGLLRGGSGPMWSGRGQRWHHDAGLATCGDAASLVDPITGEGITAALESGTAAGRALAEYLFTGRDSTALIRYSAWLTTTYRERYRPTAGRRVWANLCQAANGQ